MSRNSCHLTNVNFMLDLNTFKQGVKMVQTMKYWDTYQVPYFSWEHWRSCSILLYFLLASSTLLWSWGALAQFGFETKKLFASCTLEDFSGSILLTAVAISWKETSGLVSWKIHKYSLSAFWAKLRDDATWETAFKLKTRMKQRSYPHILQAVSAVLQWPVLLQRRAHSCINCFLLFVQVTDDFIQTSHQLAALLLLLVWGHTQSHTAWWISLFGFICSLQWHRMNT